MWPLFFAPEEAKRLVIFGDSIAKGVMFQDGRYHLCRAHDFDALAQQGVEVLNFAKMGACTDTGLAIAKKQLELCQGAQVLLSFGGNDCDFDWQAVSDHPEEAHLPKIPAEQFLENYRALMDLVRQTASRVWISSLVPLEAPAICRVVVLVLRSARIRPSLVMVLKAAEV